MWKRWLGAKVRTANGGERMHQADVPLDDRGMAYAQRFVNEHASRDLYWTPTIFKNAKAGRRTATNAAWIANVWVDIDGVAGATTCAEAWAIVADKLDEVGLMCPNVVIGTSEAPDGLDCPLRWQQLKPSESCPVCRGVPGRHGVWKHPGEYLPRVQLFWRIEPLWVGTPENRKRWKKTAGAVADALAAAGLNVDRGASSNIVGFMRMPGSTHRLTGHRVEPVGPIHQHATTLTELNEAVGAEAPSERPRRAVRRRQSAQRTGPTSKSKRGQLMELPQLQVLAKGVPDNLRNLALYPLAKAMFADQWPLDRALSWALDWNGRCNPPEACEKVRDVVMRCYGAEGPQSEPEAFTGIDPDIVAQVVEALTGEATDPDSRLKRWFPHREERRRIWDRLDLPTCPHQIRGEPVRKPKTRAPRGRRRQTGHDAPLNRYVRVAVQVARQSKREGHPITQAQIAEAAGVSRRTIASRWDSIRCGIEHELDVHLQPTAHGFKIIPIDSGDPTGGNPNRPLPPMTSDVRGDKWVDRPRSGGVGGADPGDPGPSPPARSVKRGSHRPEFNPAGPGRFEILWRNDG